jgi:hypothetical protein
MLELAVLQPRLRPPRQWHRLSISQSQARRRGSALVDVPLNMWIKQSSQSLHATAPLGMLL